MPLTLEQQALIAPFVTNLDLPVFGFKNLPSSIVGAIFSKYSRSLLSAREMLAREFLNGVEYDPNTPITTFEAVINVDRAKEFFNRVLAEYGDKSVQQLGTDGKAFEGVSNLMEVLITDRRLGLAPLVKSSRYVRFDRRDEEGNYPYFRDPKIVQSQFGDSFVRVLDALFELYTQCIPALIDYFRSKYPQAEGIEKAAYDRAIRAQACDVARYLLPMATKTNVGVVANAQAYEYLLYQLWSEGIAETQYYGDGLYADLLTTMEPYFGTVTRYGPSMIAYLSEVKALQRKAVPGTKEENRVTKSARGLLRKQGVTLIGYDPQGENKIAAAWLYRTSTDMDMGSLRIRLQQEEGLVKRILEEVLAKHAHLYQKPPRAFENAEYEFDGLCDLGAWRDLHRHRIMTQDRQEFSTRHGFVTPPEFAEVGLEEEYRHVMQQAADVFDILYPVMPLQAQYCVPFGYLQPFYFKMNARQAYHLCELRTGQSGHPSYRFIAQEIAKNIQRVHPTVGKFMRLNMNEHEALTRLAAETRTEERLRTLPN